MCAFWKLKLGLENFLSNIVWNTIHLLSFPGWLWLDPGDCGTLAEKYFVIFLNPETGKFPVSPSPSNSWFYERNQILPVLSLASVLHFEAKTGVAEEEDKRPSSSSKWGCSSEIVIVKRMPSLQAQQVTSAPRHMPGASIAINGSCVCMWAEDRSCLCINSPAMVHASSCVCYKRGSLLQLVAVSPSSKKETGSYA